MRSRFRAGRNRRAFAILLPSSARSWERAAGQGLVSQLRADPLHDLSEPHGVEPDGWVRFSVLFPEVQAVQHLDRRALGTVGRLLEGGLEPAARIEDEVGRANPLDVARAGSTSWGSAPAGVRFVTSTRFATSSAANGAGRSPQRPASGRRSRRTRRLRRSPKQRARGPGHRSRVYENDSRFHSVLACRMPASEQARAVESSRASASRPTRRRLTVLVRFYGGARRRDGSGSTSASAGGERLGLATVYRTLGLLAEEGVIDPLAPPGEPATASAGTATTTIWCARVVTCRRTRGLRARPLARPDLRGARLRHDRPPARGVRDLRRLPRLTPTGSGRPSN